MFKEYEDALKTKHPAVAKLYRHDGMTRKAVMWAAQLEEQERGNTSHVHMSLLDAAERILDDEDLLREARDNYEMHLNVFRPALSRKYLEPRMMEIPQYAALTDTQKEALFSLSIRQYETNYRDDPEHAKDIPGLIAELCKENLTRYPISEVEEQYTRFLKHKQERASARTGR